MTLVSAIFLLASLSLAPLAYGLDRLSDNDAEVRDAEPEAAPEAALGGDLAFAPQVPASAWFQLKAAVETAQPRLFLADLATCSGDQEICAEASGIDLGPSPEPGKTSLWTQAKVVEVMAKEWPEAQLQMRGAKQAKVVAQSQLLDEARVLEALTAHLASVMGVDASEQDSEPSSQQEPEEPATVSRDLRIGADHVTLTGSVKVRPGELLLEFPELTAARLLSQPWQKKALSGPQRVVLLSRSKSGIGGDAAQVLAVNVQFTVKERRLVAARSLSRGSLVETPDVTTAWMSVGRSTGRYATDLTQLVGRRLRRDISAEAALMLGDVEAPRLLKRGQMATLSWHSHGLSITSQVRLLADGVLGQPVEAVYLSTKKKLRVLPIDNHTVQLAD